MAPRVLFHVQHLLGIGHVKRAAALARAMAEAGLEVTILAGGEAVAGIGFGPASVIELPPVRALDVSFKTLVDAAGKPIDDAFREERRRRVLAAFDAVRPAILLLEAFPFARRAFRFELLPLLERARAAVPRPLIATSVRDILVAKNDPARRAEVTARVRDAIDLVLVHGDPRLVPFEASFPDAAAIAGKLRYTGYVQESAVPEETVGSGDGSGEVLVSAGGGAVGGALMRAALAARPLSSLAERTWRLVTGPNLPAADQEALAAATGSGVIVERFRRDLPVMLRRCLVSVSQAGYNTAVDILAARCHAVLVPFAAMAETEQRLRAERLAALGLARVVEESELSPSRLAAAIDEAMAMPPPASPAIDLDGARRSAALLAALAGKGKEA